MTMTYGWLQENTCPDCKGHRFWDRENGRRFWFDEPGICPEYVGCTYCEAYFHLTWRQGKLIAAGRNGTSAQLRKPFPPANRRHEL